jgi:hypothetical protein
LNGNGGQPEYDDEFLELGQLEFIPSCLDHEAPFDIHRQRFCCIPSRRSRSGGNLEAKNAGLKPAFFLIVAISNRFTASLHRRGHRNTNREIAYKTMRVRVKGKSLRAWWVENEAKVLTAGRGAGWLKDISEWKVE